MLAKQVRVEYVCTALEASEGCRELDGGPHSCAELPTDSSSQGIQAQPPLWEQRPGLPTASPHIPYPPQSSHLALPEAALGGPCAQKSHPWGFPAQWVICSAGPQPLRLRSFGGALGKLPAPSAPPSWLCCCSPSLWDSHGAEPEPRVGSNSAPPQARTPCPVAHTLLGSLLCCPPLGPPGIPPHALGSHAFSCSRGDSGLGESPAPASPTRPPSPLGRHLLWQQSKPAFQGLLFCQGSAVSHHGRPAPWGLTLPTPPFFWLYLGPWGRRETAPCLLGAPFPFLLLPRAHLSFRHWQTNTLFRHLVPTVLTQSQLRLL